MGRIIFGLGLIALVIFGLVWAFDPAYKQQRADAAFYAADQARHEAAVTATQDTLRLQQQQRDAQHDAQRAQQLAPITTGLTIWTYVLLGLALGVAVVAGAGFCIVFLGRRALFVQPSTQGVLPTPLVGFDRLAAQSGAALGLFHQAAIQRAIHGPGQTPQSISTHYAPQFRNEQRNAVDGSTGLPLLPLEAVIGVPTFAQLLDQGRIGRGQPLLLGVDEAGDEVSGSWLDLYSTIVSGLPGSGKTTSQRFLACQTALQGARFVIVDPHAGAADDSLAATLAPLSSAFLCAPASDDKAILSAAQLVADIGKRRISGKDTSTYPVILWLDETTSLLSRSTVAGALATLLEAIAQEYRKKNVFACASGQIWSASRTGDDSALRDSFASVICHRMKRSQARLLIPTDEAQTAERLGTGQAVLWRTSGETSVISVPNTTAGDVVRVAGLLTDDAPTMERIRPASNEILGTLLEVAPEATWKSDGSQTEAIADATNRATESGIVPPAEQARILALFASGSEVKEIARDLRPGLSSGSREYARLRAMIEATIRKALAAGGAA